MGRTPLQLVSNKSCFGHTEGAAGLAGLLLAAAGLGAAGAPPIMHLRNCNPHLATALDSWRSQSGLTAALPLQFTGQHSLTLSCPPSMVFVFVSVCSELTSQTPRPCLSFVFSDLIW